MKEKVKIVEVGPRDGLQNESKILDSHQRVEFIRQLVDTGIEFLEGGSFVSSKAVPQMAHSEEVWSAFQDNADIDLCFLAANEKGLDRAIEAKVRSVAFFTATSDMFNQKNIRKNVEESLRLFSPLIQRACQNGMRVRGYISTAFGCPYEGPQSIDKALKVAQSLFDAGCEEVSLGDTIGVAHPAEIKKMFHAFASRFELEKIAAHLHDTRGAALVNIREALERGVRIFDSSIGGLGGCPFATASSGNVATEEVAWLLEGLGFQTGLSLSKLLKVAQWVESQVERPLQAKFYLSKPQRLYYSLTASEESAGL